MKARYNKSKELTVTLTEEEYKQLKADITEQALRQGAIQGIAAMLAGLSKHGYGKKRLQDVLNWAQEILSMPNFCNQQLTSEQVIDYLNSNFECDVEALQFNIDSTIGGDDT